MSSYACCQPTPISHDQLSHATQVSPVSTDKANQLSRTTGDKLEHCLICTEKYDPLNPPIRSTNMKGTVTKLIRKVKTNMVNDHTKVLGVELRMTTLSAALAVLRVEGMWILYLPLIRWQVASRGGYHTLTRNGDVSRYFTFTSYSQSHRLRLSTQPRQTLTSIHICIYIYELLL